MAETCSTSPLKPLNETKRNLTESTNLNVFYKVLCRSRSEKQDGRKGLCWLIHFQLVLWNRRVEFNKTWQEARCQLPLPSLCFSGQFQNEDSGLASVCWDIFDFSESAERNSMRLDRKQDFNILYQLCVFRTIRKTRWPLRPLIGWDIFDFSESAEKELSDTRQKARSQHPLLCLWFFSGRTVNQDSRPRRLMSLDIFDFSFKTAEQNSTKHER